jgi:hypothetical protein
MGISIHDPEWGEFTEELAAELEVYMDKYDVPGCQDRIIKILAEFGAVSYS